MIISELVLSYLSSLLYDSSKEIPRKILDTHWKIYDKAIEELSNTSLKLNKINIDTFLHQQKVETAIEEYLKNPNKADCLSFLINEFFELFSKEDFSLKDANLILNTFFEIIDSEIEKDPELRDYLKIYLAKKTDKTIEEINQELKETRQEVQKLSFKIDGLLINNLDNKSVPLTSSELQDKKTKSNVPYPLNPFFIGRDEKLKQIHETLLSNKRAVLSQPVAICGLGGIGKTQTAVQYTYLYSHEYEFVLWITADSEDSVISGYVSVAKLLDLPLKNDSDQKLIVSAVLNWLKNNGNWLLVFDNVNDPSVLRNLMPLNSKGHVLFTSRAPLFEELENPSQIEMDKMLPDEAREFFIKRTGRKNLKSSELKALDDLISEFDYLPLAIEQAGAYIRKIECSFEDYLSSYKISGLKLLEKSQISIDKYPKSVATTWLLNFENIEKDSKVSAEILFASAFLNSFQIPVDIFIKGAKKLGPLISSALENVESLPVVLYDFFEPIRQYSLITRDINNYTYDIHRLVQAVLRDGMDETTQRIWVERIVKALNCAFPEIEYNNWELCDKLLPHIQTCEKYIKKWNMETKEFAKLLNSTGNYLYERARFKECELYFNSAFDIRKKILDSNHPEVAESLNDLAALYEFRGRYSEAELLSKRALEIREIVFGPEHPDTAASLNILAGTYKSQGRYSEAEPLFKRALEIREKVLGFEHPDTAVSLDNLAGIYRSQGRYPEAETFLKRALEIKEKIFGSEHPNTALSLDNLSVLYQNQGKYSEAELLSKRALDIYEIVSGSEHPDTAISLCNLAGCYTNQGKYPEAEPLLKRAQEIEEKVLGSEHPGTATSLNNLATLYQGQGKYSEAEPLFKRALEIREKVLGFEHPDTAVSLDNLAGIYRSQGRYPEAEPLLKRAQEINEKALGLEHPATALSLGNFSTSLKIPLLILSPIHLPQTLHR